MKRIAMLAMMAAAGLSAVAQTADPVIMKINGKAITRSAFEYSFNKNNSDGVIDKKTVDEYVPLFVDFKLKVAEAERLGVDTIAAIRTELEGFKEQMVIPTLVDSAFIERKAKEVYENTAARYAGADLLSAKHILVLLRQDATAEQQAAGKALIDSIYGVLKATPKDQLEDRFSELAKAKSDDSGSAQRGGALPRFGKGQLIPDLEKVAYALQPGEMSAPVLTPMGYHLLYLKERSPFEPYDFHHDAILQFLDRQGVREASANAYLDSVSAERNITRSELVEELLEGVLAADDEQRNLMQEYYDGTLMYEVTKRSVWDKAQHDAKGQEAYFNAHKSDYAWDSPRFCGVIIHSKDAKTASAAKRLLKGVAEEDYVKTLLEALNTDSVKVVRVNRGIYKQGDNANVDKLVFKQKKELKPQKDFPVTTVYGKKVKAPRTYKDVRGQVTSDYQNEQEQKWVEGLRRRFSVEIFEDVVKTVNNH